MWGVPGFKMGKVGGVFPASAECGAGGVDQFRHLFGERLTGAGRIGAEEPSHLKNDAHQTTAHREVRDGAPGPTMDTGGTFPTSWTRPGRSGQPYHQGGGFFPDDLQFKTQPRSSSP